MLITFDGRSFHPHGILTTFSIYLGWKKVEVNVEMVDPLLDYKLLLGHNWTYAMTAFESFIFHNLFFPHNGVGCGA
jgi:hypothetical protein